MQIQPEKRVYVLEPYVPRGGTYMAYNLARILMEDFGFQAIAVSDSNTNPNHGIFRYEHSYPIVTSASMMARIRDDDILIANPSFSSLGMGLRAKGTKLMYLQGFNTYELLDCRFDHFVSVSSFVQSFIFSTYGISTNVVPPFLDIDSSIPCLPWADRPAGSCFVWTKGGSPLRASLLRHLQKLLPEVNLTPSHNATISHEDFLRKLGMHRYFITLSPAEGFGLPALEAMAMGATVIGFDGFGGRDFMKSDVNCVVRPFPDIEGIAKVIRILLMDTKAAEKIAEAGRATATERRFSYEGFREAWEKNFCKILGAI